MCGLEHDQAWGKGLRQREATHGQATASTAGIKGETHTLFSGLLADRLRQQSREERVKGALYTLNIDGLNHITAFSLLIKISWALTFYSFFHDIILMDILKTGDTLTGGGYLIMLHPPVEHISVKK